MGLERDTFLKKGEISNVCRLWEYCRHLLQLRNLSTSLLASMRPHPQDPRSPTMLPSYIHLHSGQETGTPLAVDLGGSTLRAAVMTLSGGVTNTVRSRKSWANTDNVKQLAASRFFEADWSCGYGGGYGGDGTGCVPYVECSNHMVLTVTYLGRRDPRATRYSVWARGSACAKSSPGQICVRIRGSAEGEGALP